MRSSWRSWAGRPACPFVTGCGCGRAYKGGVPAPCAAVGRGAAAGSPPPPTHPPPNPHSHRHQITYRWIKGELENEAQEQGKDLSEYARSMVVGTQVCGGWGGARGRRDGRIMRVGQRLAPGGPLCRGYASVALPARPAHRRPRLWASCARPTAKRASKTRAALPLCQLLPPEHRRLCCSSADLLFGTAARSTLLPTHAHFLYATLYPSFPPSPLGHACSPVSNSAFFIPPFSALSCPFDQDLPNLPAQRNEAARQRAILCSFI